MEQESTRAARSPEAPVEVELLRPVRGRRPALTLLAVLVLVDAGAESGLGAGGRA